MKKLTGPTILIVDDKPHDRCLIGPALNRAGLGLAAQSVTGRQETAAYLDGDGVYAERLIFPYPSLIVIELEMPRGDGFSVLLHLRQNPLTQLLPVLMFSSSEDPDHMWTAYRLGATLYCIKPQTCAGLLPILSGFFQCLPRELWRTDPSSESPFSISENRNNHA
jgi:CheY-like chemotaxis protein